MLRRFRCLQIFLKEGNDTGEVIIAQGSSVEFCEAVLIGLADESEKFLYGRETDRDLRSA